MLYDLAELKFSDTDIIRQVLYYLTLQSHVWYKDYLIYKFKQNSDCKKYPLALNYFSNCWWTMNCYSADITTHGFCSYLYYYINMILLMGIIKAFKSKQSLYFPWNSTHTL